MGHKVKRFSLPPWSTSYPMPFPRGNHCCSVPVSRTLVFLTTVNTLFVKLGAIINSTNNYWVAITWQLLWSAQGWETKETRFLSFRATRGPVWETGSHCRSNPGARTAQGQSAREHERKSDGLSSQKNLPRRKCLVSFLRNGCGWKES